MLVGFTELKEKFFNVSDIFVSKQCSEKKTSIDMCAEPRPTDALLFFKSGNAVCYQQGSEPYFVSQGSLMYMPKGSRYIWDTLPSVATGKNERILFEFNLSIKTVF